MATHPGWQVGRYQKHTSRRVGRGNRPQAMQSLLRYPESTGEVEYLPGVQEPMTRLQLEHIIRASEAIAEVDRLVIIGSQSILGSYPDAAILPKNWEKRLVRIKNLNTNNIEGLCLSPVDPGISRLLAARKKDIAFVRTMLKKGLLSIGDMQKITHELSADHKNRLESRLLQFSGN